MAFDGCTVKLNAAANPAFTVTVSVCVTTTPLMVADRIFAPAAVELSVPVATPAPLVVPTGWVRVFPVPVAASTTVAPAMGFPLPSRAVTVMVAVLDPALAVIVAGEATRLDCGPEIDPVSTLKAAEVPTVSPPALARSA